MYPDVPFCHRCGKNLRSGRRTRSLNRRRHAAAAAAAERSSALVLGGQVGAASYHVASSLRSSVMCLDVLASTSTAPRKQCSTPILGLARLSFGLSPVYLGAHPVSYSAHCCRNLAWGFCPLLATVAACFAIRFSQPRSLRSGLSMFSWHLIPLGEKNDAACVRASLTLS